MSRVRRSSTAPALISGFQRACANARAAVIINKINLNKDRERQAREAVHDLVRAVHAGDAESFCDAAEALDTFPNCWRDFMRKVAKKPCPSDDFRKGFLKIWLRDGDTIRLGVDDDLVLCDGLAVTAQGTGAGAPMAYHGRQTGTRREGTRWVCGASLKVAVCYWRRRRHQRLSSPPPRYWATITGRRSTLLIGDA